MTEQETTPPVDPYRWRALVVISLAVAIIIADATVVNVIIPVVINDLGITTADAEWVTSVYALVFASLLITVGRLADLHGRRRLLLIGTSVFLLASIACALSQTGGQLIGARVVQGVGAAMVLPATLSTINATFTGKDRSIAFAVWGSTIGGMAAAGPLLGGWLTTTFSWRWTFGINLVVGAVIIAGLFAWVRESREPATRPGTDLLGTGLSIVGLGGIVFALIEGQRYGWWEATAQAADDLGWSLGVAPTVPAAVVGLAAVLAFFAVERRRTRADRVVLLDLTLFAIPSFRNGNFTAAVISLGEFGLLFGLPLYLQNILGLSATATGGVIFALAAGSFVAAPLAPKLTSRFGARTVVRIGLVAEILGVAGIAVLADVPASAWRFVPTLFLYGIGVGLATAQLTGVILADVPLTKSGQASGTQSTSRQIGSALGVAVIGAVLVTTLGSAATTRLTDAGVPAAERTAIVDAATSTAGASIAALRASSGDSAPTVVALEHAYVDATRAVGFTAAGFLLLGLLASFSLGHSRPRAEEDAAGPGVRAAEDPAGQGQVRT